MSFEIKMSICNNIVYTVYGHRLTSNDNGINNYEYVGVHSPLGSESPNSTNSLVAEGELTHLYTDGLMVLCEKVLTKINKEMEE